MIYWLKEVFGTLDLYLVANVEKEHFKYVRVLWSTNCVDYLKREIENFDNSLGIYKTDLNNYGDGHRPYSYSFGPELNAAEELV